MLFRSGAFKDWASRKPRERGEILRKAYELIMQDAEQIVALDLLLTEAFGEVSEEQRDSLKRIEKSASRLRDLVEWTLDLSRLDEFLTDRVKLLSMVHISNSLGTINPVIELCAKARKKGITTLVDGAPDAITPDWMNDRLAEARLTGISHAEGKLRRAGTEPFWGQSILFCTEPGLSSDGYVLLLRDTGDHRDTIDSLMRAAKSDQLTGLANRRALYEAAELELKRHAIKPRDITLLMLDIDHFKKVNDNYGHPFGDKVICAIANAIKSVKG